MNKLEEWLSKACDALGLHADIGFALVLGVGHELQTIARIPFVGATNGMLVVHSYEEVREHADHLIQSGYGYSVLDEPRPNEEFDLDSFRDMFADWGWCGEPMQKPNWMP